MEAYGGYVDPAWKLTRQYDMPTILREAIEDYLATNPVLPAADRRLG